MGGVGPHRTLDAASLPGLAHPLRVRLLEQLTQYGPATATQLGARLDESSGATSYHLRQLERYGFVEEDPGRGSGRERWWRRVPGGLRINTPELTEDEDAATKEAAQLVVNEFNRGRLSRLQRWYETFPDWPREWQDASAQGSFTMRLTVDELSGLADEIDEVVSRWKQRSEERIAAGGAEGDEFRHVEVQLAAFPLPDPDRPADQ